ncbi:MAG: phospholipid carrier-dependent glycosyltransferase [Actinobacteria bacterium]|nr:phospholipid carrier-dependent glycosyltransferase [Actinomycetota bacterium]
MFPRGTPARINSLTASLWPLVSLSIMRALMARPIFNHRNQIALAFILLFAAITRFANLGRPNELVFDEVYYVDGARDFLAYGVENQSGEAEFVVHPPLGKWLIAIGIQIFGDNPFGWRFSAALFGLASVALIYFITQSLFKSNFLSLSATALISFDGLHLVMSRTALLDIFLSFFILLTFYLVIKEKYWQAGITIGLALATKWNALYLLLALILFLLFYKRRYVKTAFQFTVLPVSTYLISWSGWFLSDIGWKRDSGNNSLISLIDYHREMLDFHTNLKTDHPYEASPWNWLILGRPTSFFYATPKQCGEPSCSQEVLAMGTPMLWWLGFLSIFITLGYFIYRRELSAGLILLFLFANYLPWIAFPERTTFYFYSIAFEPYLILTLIYVMSKALENQDLRGIRQKYALVTIGLIGLTFAYFLPLYVGSVLPYQDWYGRMWFPSWI